MQMDDRAPRPAYWAVMPSDVLDSPTLGDKAKLIYVEISRMIGPQGYCWARDKYLAERVGCSTRTVSRAIHDLETAGVIRVEMSANRNGTERHIYAGLSPAAGGIDTSGETPLRHNIIEKRMQWNKDLHVDIAIVSQGKLVQVLRF